MLKRESVWLSLGSNVGDREANLSMAKEELLSLKIEIVQASSLYETAPFGRTDQPDFLNQVLKIRTSLEPLKLLFFTKNIEGKLGRVRREKWGPREIDIDILFYNILVVNLPDLTVPHPGIPNRRFILVPLAEMEPEFRHPGNGKTVREMLETVSDDSSVRLFIPRS